MIDNDVVACVRCGRHRDAGVSPAEAMAWVSERDGATTRWLCPQCARAHVRDIEGKLPREYW